MFSCPLVLSLVKPDVLWLGYSLVFRWLLVIMYVSAALVDLGRLFSFLLYTQQVWLLRRGISLSQNRYLHTEQHKQISMPRLGLELRISVFERRKTVHALDRAATRICCCHYTDRFIIIIIVMDLINVLSLNSSVNTVQHATVDEAVFSVDPTDAPIDLLDNNHVKCVYCRSMSVPIFSSERMLYKDYYRKSSVQKTSLVVGLKGLTPRRTDWR
jgi:hypothetical protein